MRSVPRSGWGSKVGLVLFALTFCAVASAIPITGGFGTTAAGVLTFANSGNTVHFIDWCPINTSPPPGTANGPITCAVGGSGTGDLLASGGFGTFAFIPPNPPGPPVPGTIKDMVDNAAVAPYTQFPAGVPVSINNFLTLTGFPNFNFRAEFLVPQTCAPSATTACIGPFILTQSGNNVSVSMSILGTVLDTTNALQASAFTYIITGQFNNTTIAAVANAAQTQPGVYSNTWSGSLITSNIPEPSTIYLALGALLGVLGLAKFRRSKPTI